MRLNPGRLPELAKDLLRSLIKDGGVMLVDDRMQEAEMDIEWVLREYHRQEREIHEQSKDLLAARGIDYGNLRKVKMLIAAQRKLKIGDEGYDYIIDQIVEILFHSNNVEEIFAADIDLRKRMLPVLKKYTAEDDAIEEQARTRLKNLDEGTVTWDIEIARQISEIRRERNA